MKLFGTEKHAYKCFDGYKKLMIIYE